MNVNSFKIRQLAASQMEETILQDAKYVNILKHVEYIAAGQESENKSAIYYNKKAGLFSNVSGDVEIKPITANYNDEFLSLYLLDVVNCLFIQTYSHGTAFWSTLDAHRSVRLPIIDKHMQKQYVDAFKQCLTTQRRLMIHQTQ